MWSTPRPDLILAADVHPADQGDAATMVDTVMQAQSHLVAAGVGRL